MKRDLLIGFGAFSALMMLVGIDMALTLVLYKGQRASTVILKSIRSPLARR